MAAVLLSFRSWKLFISAILFLVLFNGQSTASSVPSKPGKKASSSGDNTHDYQKLLRDIFGENFLPQNANAPQPATPVAVSKYMNRLFEKYRLRPEFRKSDLTIIRSIMPQKGIVHRSVDFHLRALSPNENITRARLHVRYRVKKGRISRNRKFTAYQLQDDGTLTEFEPIGSSSHWLIFNLDQSVRSAHQRSKPISFMFGKVKNGKKRFFSAKRVLRRVIPFLVIHSKEIPKIRGREKQQNSIGSNGEETSFKNRATGGSITMTRPQSAMGRKKSTSKRPRRIWKRSVVAAAPPAESLGSYFSYSMGGADPDSDTKTHGDPVSHRRASFESEIREKGPDSVLQSRRELKKQEKRRFLAQRMGTPAPSNKPTFTREIVEYHPYSPENMNPKIILLGSKEVPKKQSKSCGLHKFTVNFKDIGWDHWIIRPSSFEANYCDGSCSATPGENSGVRQTNHAIIQNIVFNLGQHPEVPMPCCAPDRFDSLTMLYYDEDGNVVLKNYPKMSIESCACL